MNENLSLFSKNINDCDYKEETKMERVMEINEADNYRMDKRSMFSLLEDKKSGDINCKYILQRKPFQWTQEERNRYICRRIRSLPHSRCQQPPAYNPLWLSYGCSYPSYN